MVAVTVRLPPDVLERWKAKGNDWRTKMAERLKG
nr:BrnA antitoxin family protein [Mesorhizobium sp. BE184]